MGKRKHNEQPPKEQRLRLLTPEQLEHWYAGIGRVKYNIQPKTKHKAKPEYLHGRMRIRNASQLYPGKWIMDKNGFVRQVQYMHDGFVWLSHKDSPHRGRKHPINRLILWGAWDGK